MSIRVTRWPRLSSASATPLPVVSDTSRSADQPPISTAMWSLSTSCLAHSHALDFPFELDAAMRLHAPAAPPRPAPRCRRRSPSPRLSRKLQCFSDTWASPTASPRQPACVDQLPGLGARRVLEGRAAGLGAQRLRRLALGGDAVHLGLDRGRLARHGRGRSRRRRSRLRAARCGDRCSRGRRARACARSPERSTSSPRPGCP